MRVYQRLVAGAVALGMAALVAPVAAADTEEETSMSERASASVVQISIELTGFVYIEPISAWTVNPIVLNYVCSGYIVDSTGYIATAGYCLDDTPEGNTAGFYREVGEQLTTGTDRDPAEPTQRARDEDWPITGPGGTISNPTPLQRVVQVKQAPVEGSVINDWTVVQVVDWQPFDEGDNALLKLNDNTVGLVPLPIASAVPEPGQAVTAMGFAKANDRESAPPVARSGTVTGRGTNNAGIATTDISAEAVDGLTGGPTVDELGNVIGTNSYASSDADGEDNYYLTDNIALASYLTSNGVVLTKEFVVEKDSKSSTMFLALGIGLAVVIIALVAVGILLLKRRKKVATATSTGDNFTNYDPQYNQPQQPSQPVDPYGWANPATPFEQTRQDQQPPQYFYPTEDTPPRDPPNYQ
jgi:serine protease Do